MDDEWEGEEALGDDIEREACAYLDVSRGEEDTMDIDVEGGGGGDDGAHVGVAGARKKKPVLVQTQRARFVDYPPTHDVFNTFQAPGRFQTTPGATDRVEEFDAQVAARGIVLADPSAVGMVLAHAKMPCGRDPTPTRVANDADTIFKSMQTVFRRTVDAEEKKEIVRDVLERGVRRWREMCASKGARDDTIPTTTMCEWILAKLPSNFWLEQTVEHRGPKKRHRACVLAGVLNLSFVSFAEYFAAYARAFGATSAFDDMLDVHMRENDMAGDERVWCGDNWGMVTGGGVDVDLLLDDRPLPAALKEADAATLPPWGFAVRDAVVDHFLPHAKTSTCVHALVEMMAVDPLALFTYSAKILRNFLRDVAGEDLDVRARPNRRVNEFVVGGAVRSICALGARVFIGPSMRVWGEASRRAFFAPVREENGPIKFAAFAGGTGTSKTSLCVDTVGDFFSQTLENGSNAVVIYVSFINALCAKVVADVRAAQRGSATFGGGAFPCFTSAQIGHLIKSAQGGGGGGGEGEPEGEGEADADADAFVKALITEKCVFVATTFHSFPTRVLKRICTANRLRGGDPAQLYIVLDEATCIFEVGGTMEARPAFRAFVRAMDTLWDWEAHRCCHFVSMCAIDGRVAEDATPLSVLLANRIMEVAGRRKLVATHVTATGVAPCSIFSQKQGAVVVFPTDDPGINVSLLKVLHQVLGLAVVPGVPTPGNLHYAHGEHGKGRFTTACAEHVRRRLEAEGANIARGETNTLHFAGSPLNSCGGAPMTAHTIQRCVEGMCAVTNGLTGDRPSAVYIQGTPGVAVGCSFAATVTPGSLAFCEAGLANHAEHPMPRHVADHLRQQREYCIAEAEGRIDDTVYSPDERRTMGFASALVEVSSTDTAARVLQTASRARNVVVTGVFIGSEHTVARDGGRSEEHGLGVNANAQTIAGVTMRGLGRARYEMQRLRLAGVPAGLFSEPVTRALAALVPSDHALATAMGKIGGRDAIVTEEELSAFWGCAAEDEQERREEEEEEAVEKKKKKEAKQQLYAIPKGLSYSKQEKKAFRLLKEKATMDSVVDIMLATTKRFAVLATSHDAVEWVWAMTAPHFPFRFIYSILRNIHIVLNAMVPSPEYNTFPLAAMGPPVVHSIEAQTRLLHSRTAMCRHMYYRLPPDAQNERTLAGLLAYLNGTVAESDAYWSALADHNAVAFSKTTTSMFPMVVGFVAQTVADAAARRGLLHSAGMLLLTQAELSLLTKSVHTGEMAIAALMRAAVSYVVMNWMTHVDAERLTGPLLVPYLMELASEPSGLYVIARDHKTQTPVTMGLVPFFLHRVTSLGKDMYHLQLTHEEHAKDGGADDDALARMAAFFAPISEAEAEVDDDTVAAGPASWASKTVQKYLLFEKEGADPLAIDTEKFIRRTLAGVLASLNPVPFKILARDKRTSFLEIGLVPSPAMVRRDAAAAEWDTATLPPVDAPVDAPPPPPVDPGDRPEGGSVSFVRHHKERAARNAIAAIKKQRARLARAQLPCGPPPPKARDMDDDDERLLLDNGIPTPYAVHRAYMRDNPTAPISSFPGVCMHGNEPPDSATRLVAVEDGYDRVRAVIEDALRTKTLEVEAACRSNLLPYQRMVPSRGGGDDQFAVALDAKITDALNALRVPADFVAAAAAGGDGDDERLVPFGAGAGDDDADDDDAYWEPPPPRAHGGGGAGGARGAGYDRLVEPEVQRLAGGSAEGGGEEEEEEDSPSNDKHRNVRPRLATPVKRSSLAYLPEDEDEKTRPPWVVCEHSDARADALRTPESRDGRSVWSGGSGGSGGSRSRSRKRSSSSLGDRNNDSFGSRT